MMKNLALCLGLLAALLVGGQAQASEAPSPAPRLAYSPDKGGGGGNGCDSKSQLRGDTWRKNGWFWTTSRIPRLINVNLHATAIYVYCPNGRKPNKIMPTKFDLCWYQPQAEEHRQFDGVTFDGVFVDLEGRTVNPDPFKVGDDGPRQHCGTQKFAPSKRIWMRMAHMPVWKMKGSP